MAGFKQAVRSQSKLRLGLLGPSGSGKTYTGLVIGSQLAKHMRKRLAVIDTERGSASLYSDEFKFDVLEPSDFNPTRYIEAINLAESAGYGVLLIDSISHAWTGKGGVLELHDMASKRTQNSFTAWRDVTPLHNKFVDAMVSAPMHVIVTMRSKTDYVVSSDDKGKMNVRKVGLAPQQREGLEYEFDVVAEMDMDNTFIVSKTRCKALTGAIITKPGPELGDLLWNWLHEGEEAPKVEEKPYDPSIPAPTPPVAPQAATDVYATNVQLKAIFLIAKNECGKSEEDTEIASFSIYGLPPANLSKKQASEFIDRLKAGTVWQDFTEGRPLTPEQADNAERKTTLLKQIAEDMPHALLSEAQLSKKAKEEKGLERYQDAQIDYLQELADRVKARRQEQETKHG